MSSLTIEMVVLLSRSYEFHWKKNEVLWIMEKNNYMDVAGLISVEGAQWLEECL